MKQHDFKNFSSALTAISELYGKTMSQGFLMLWWQSLERFDFEQVSKALNAHTQDANSGQFMPKPADLIRILEGTTTDRAAIAWGKAHDAAARVGAYSDVVFDDPAIHSAIEDMGGWQKFCRSETKELSYMQHRFCELHRTYAGRGDFEFPRILMGDRSPDFEYEKNGLKPPKPAFIGNEQNAKAVYMNGSSNGKTAITFSDVATLASHGVSEIAESLQMRLAA